jgi:hypothetical protein
MESGTSVTTCLCCYSTKTRILRYSARTTTHVTVSEAKEHFGAFWNYFERLGPPICGLVFPFGLCEALFSRLKIEIGGLLTLVMCESLWSGL